MATDEIENMTKEQFQQLASIRLYYATVHGGKFTEWGFVGLWRSIQTFV